MGDRRSEYFNDDQIAEMDAGFPTDAAVAVAQQFTIWALHCPFRKDGSPVLGNMGSSIEGVIVMKAETWKKLCAAHPTLNTQQFRVGTAE